MLNAEIEDSTQSIAQSDKIFCIQHSAFIIILYFCTRKRGKI